jgi:hypothetical protein
LQPRIFLPEVKEVHMKPYHTFCAAALAAVLSSCTASYQPPKLYSVETERTYAIPFDSVWQDAVDWFATHNTPIKTMDKGSGLIASDYGLAVASYQSYCDCGSGGTGLVSKRIESPVGNVNLLIKRIDEAHTRIKVSTFFKAILVTTQEARGEVMASETVNCNTTGKLEKEILDGIQR